MAMSDKDKNALLASMEDVKVVVETMTGVRQQFIDLGWPPEQAGEATNNLFRMAANAQQAGTK